MAVEPVRHPRLLCRRRPRRDDAQVAIDLHGIGIDDDAAGFLRQRQRQRRLAAGGRPCDKHRLVCSMSEFTPACPSSPRSSAIPPTPRSIARSWTARAPFCPRPAPAQWLFDEVAVDIPFDGSDDIKAIEARLREARGDLPIDIVVQPAGVPAQEAFSGRHGFHHDRPGMHRRTGGFRRPEGPCRRDHRTRDARRDRVRAGAARARRAAEGPAGRRGRRSAENAHHADAGRPRTGHDHARPWRLYLPDLGRLYAVHQRGRRHDRISGKPRQRIEGRGRQTDRRGHRADPGPRRQARHPDRTARSPSISTTSTRW